jgi:hypothetical protein
MTDDKGFRLIEFGACLVLLCGLAAMTVFGCITVRRLRRHPELQDLLGWRPLPGFATLNAAAALSSSRSLVRTHPMTPLRSLSADPAALHRNTAPWERRLARFAYRTIESSIPMFLWASDMQQWGAVTGSAIAAGHAAVFLLGLAILASALSFGERVRLWRIARFGRNKLDRWWDNVLDKRR